MCVQISFAQDTRLWYKQPAVKWTEALPIGNGRIGAMIFGGVADDRIQFNEETLWTGEPRDYNKPGAYKYLDSIRQLLFAGKQKEAEALTGEEFMGTKSDAGKKDVWVKNMLALKGMKGNPALPGYDDSKWKTMSVPSYEGWEAVGFEGMDGAVWFRTSFDMPVFWNGKDVQLDINKIRDYDLTYVNGKLIGTQNNGDARNYVIPANVLHSGKNSIAIQVINLADKGGIAGYKDTSRQIGVYPVGKETEKISLNGDWKYFIQDDEPPAIGEYQASYQPFGDLLLHFNNVTGATNYARGLDIVSAIAGTSFTVNEIDYSRQYFVSQPNQVAVVHLTASEKGHINFEAALSSPHKKYTLKKIDANTIALHVQVRNGALHGESYLRVVIRSGTLKIDDDKIIVSNADEATLYLTAGTNYKNYKDVSANASLPCINALKSIDGKTYNEIMQAHIKEYQQYFNTFFIKLTNSAAALNEKPAKWRPAGLPTDERLVNFATSNDPSFVALYMQYGRYLLISSSRPGTKPANLQGIWNDLLAPPWGSKYTTNINAEMNYWPAELLNLSAMHTPFFGMIDDLSKTGKETAKAYYNAPGWCCITTQIFGVARRPSMHPITAFG